MVDLLFIAWNRFQFTKWSFESLLKYTEWELVDKLVVHDDGSTDGTSEYLREQVRHAPANVEVIFRAGPHLGGPVAVMNHSLLNDKLGSKYFIKMDNDIIFCKGWLTEAHEVMERNHGLGVLGLEYFDGDCKWTDEMGSAIRGWRDAVHVGGDNIMLRSLFEGDLPVANGRFGFTEWQRLRRQVKKGWITPHIPLFKVDLVPHVGIQNLVLAYREQEWQRPWPCFNPDYSKPWQWWLETDFDV